MFIYLLHFDTPIGGKRHYMGSCEEVEFAKRMRRHQTGGGSRFTTEAHRKGIGFHVGGLWQHPDRSLERTMKATHQHKLHCTICRQPEGVLPMFANVLYFAPVEPIAQFALLSFTTTSAGTRH